MSALRMIGYAGLAVLAVAGLLTLYLSIGKRDWPGVAIGVGALLLVAFLGNHLWIAGRRQKDPHFSGLPNQTLLGLLLAVLGVATGIASVERLISSSWLAASVTLVGAVLLLERAYRALLKRS
jgi:putative flippase GtrA